MVGIHGIITNPKTDYYTITSAKHIPALRQAFRGEGRKNFSGFPKGWKQSSRGSGGHSSPDAEGYTPFLHYFHSSFY